MSFALCIPQRYLESGTPMPIQAIQPGKNPVSIILTSPRAHHLPVNIWLGRSPLPSLGLQHHATSSSNKSLLVSQKLATDLDESLRISWHQLVGHIWIIGVIWYKNECIFCDTSLSLSLSSTKKYTYTFGKTFVYTVYVDMFLPVSKSFWFRICLKTKIYTQIHAL